MTLLPESWETFRRHEVQRAYYRSRHRFNVTPAGRRSGKTAIFKRRLIRRALAGTEYTDARFFAGAPTRDQAKRIFWKDLKQLLPKWSILGRPYESDLMIPLVNGAEIWVLGLDKPERIEGTPWDGGGLDEYANMKPEVWPNHVRPALGDRRGWCDLFGVPEGRNHYFKTAMAAKEEYEAHGDESEWGYFHWKSAEILPLEEVESARSQLDPLTFQQEYEAAWVLFEGRAYYTFDHALHVKSLSYDPTRTLVFCFDFNVKPGTAVIVQEQQLPNGAHGTGAIGEVWIRDHSNTPLVCERLITEWGTHPGEVRCYGDATGGARGTAKVVGNDWDIIRRALRGHFGERVRFNVPKANPSERARLNAVNSRFKSGAGTVHAMVDPRCEHLIEDFDGVRTKEDGTGEIDKKRDPMLSHPSDSFGYYIEREFPISGRETRTSHMAVI